MSIFTVLMGFIFIGILQADPLLDALLKRNGDVYLLISKPSTEDGYLYKFERSTNYSRTEPIPPDNQLRQGSMPRLAHYIGFSVDKFGHIKFFRATPDPDITDPASGGASIINLTSRLYPGASGAVPVASNTMITAYSCGYMSCPDNAAITAIGAGWRYVISPDGKEGWKRIMTNSSEPMSLSVDTGAAGDSPTAVETDLDATSGSFRLLLPDGSSSSDDPYPAGSLILPPLYKSYPLNYVTIYHASGFWRTDEGRHQFRAEAHGAPVLVNSGSSDVLPGANFNIGDDCGVLRFDDPATNDEVLWEINTVKRCDSASFSPPVGAIFLLPHVVRPAERPSGWDRRLGDPGVNPWHAFEWMRAAAIVRDVLKNKTALNVDSFLSAADNLLLKNAAETGSSVIFDELNACSDYFNACPNAESDADGNYNSNETGSYVLASTISYSVALSRLNHCGDLCGAGAADAIIAPPPPPSSTAYASSFGKNQSEQKVYLLKSGSMGGTKIITSIVQIQIDGAGVGERLLIDHEYNPATNVSHPSLGSPDTDFTSDINAQVVYRVTAAGLGCGGAVSGDFIPRSLGFSKRRDGSTDFVYYSDLPPTHFAASSNFWGTGGTLWCADDSGSDLILRYKAYNHNDSGTIDDDVKNIGPRNFLSMAADGDNSVYIVHADPTRFEGPAEMDRMIGTGLNATAIERLCTNGDATTITISSSVYANCAGLNLAAGYVPSITEPPVAVSITIKQHAGFTVEKIPAIVGASPQVIGVAPLVEVGTCTGSFLFGLSPAEMAANRFRAELDGVKSADWDCTGDASSFSAIDLTDMTVRLGVINVPNPPSSGTDIQIDIVNPCPGQTACDGENIKEDEVVVFRMENPPHFAGIPAMINQASDANLKSIGDAYPSGVRMLSNYNESGTDYTKDLLGSTVDLYFDNDNRPGNLLATALNVDYALIAANTDPKLSSGSRTMRYRWQIRALTPPHSLVDYSSNPVPYAPPENSGFTFVNTCSNVRHGVSTYVLAEESPTPQGLLYDSCWLDMNNEISGVSTSDQLMYEPEKLSYRFIDPGNYQVILMIATLAYDLSGVTYLTDPISVTSMAIVTSYAMPVTVQAGAPGSGNPFVKDVRIGANDLAADASVRVGQHLPYNDFRNLFATQKRNGFAYNEEVGAAPIFPVHYYKAEKLIVSHQDQLTPLYAEATIQFAYADSIEYASGSVDLQSKVTGVGSWDFAYRCTGACPSVGGIVLQDKSSYHPSNYSSSAAGFQISTEYGNDATAKIASSRYVNDSGTVLSASNFVDLHQGTLSNDIYYPDGRDIATSPYAFYTWYDIKYAWFIRYREPNPLAPVKQRILRTGNLAEIFLLNYYAVNGINQAAFQTLLKTIAPDEIKGSGSADLMGSPRLIQSSGNRREFHIRIPLLDHNSLLDGDVLNELDGGLLYDDSRFNAGAITYQELLKIIQPMRFPIPSGATVLEIGLQVFAPILAWEGREPIYGSSGISGYAYYDAVPGFVDSGNIRTAADPNDCFYNWCFSLGECFYSWKHPGLLKNSYGLSSLEFGLELHNNYPGFDLSGGTPYTVSPDHFVELFISDLENPFIADYPESPTITAGSASEEDLYISIQDNAPYSEWLDYDGSTRQEGVPVLSNLYYETGFDPRNSFGLGLSAGMNYSFLVSHRRDNTNNLAFKQGQVEAQPYPGKNNLSIDLSPSDFFYGSNTSANFRSNGLFLTGEWNSGDFSNAFNKASNEGFLFPPTTDNISQGIFTNAATEEQVKMNYNFLVPYFPNGDLNFFGFPTTNDFTHKIEPLFTETERGDSCLQTALPNKENPHNCYLKTTYRINKGSIIAPWFFNADYGQALKIFAVSQDARVYSEYPADIDNRPNLSDFYYRLSGKNNADLSDLSPMSTNIKTLLSSYWQQATNALAEEVAIITAPDETPPNIRVSLTDHKTRQQVYFALTTVQGLEDDGDGGLYLAEKVDLFRSADTRPIPLGGANPIAIRVDSNNFEFRIADYCSNTALPEQFFYQIPEDTRFELSVSYSDNVIERNLEGSITIESGSCEGSTAIASLYPVLRQSDYPIEGGTANLQYMDTGQIKVFHLYPRAGMYDEIKITATDQNGNSSVICIPVKVVEQSVFFRQTGQERGLNQ